MAGSKVVPLRQANYCQLGGICVLRQRIEILKGYAEKGAPVPGAKKPRDYKAVGQSKFVVWIVVFVRALYGGASPSGFLIHTGLTSFRDSSV